MPAMNPYTVAITWIWIGAFVVAGVLALMGVNAADNFDVAQAAVRFAWASLFGSVGIGTLMMWLLVNALNWKAPASSNTQGENS